MSQVISDSGEPPTDASAVVSEDGPKNPISKNAMKKAAKAERFAALKLERRAREKESRKEKKRQKAEKRAAGELEEEEEAETNRRTKKPRLQFGGTVVVDLGFDDMMNDKVSGTMCQSFHTSRPRKAVT
jgi:tRNA (guanine9-N1)-methyltransferase